MRYCLALNQFPYPCHCEKVWRMKINIIQISSLYNLSSLKQQIKLWASLWVRNMCLDYIFAGLYDRLSLGTCHNSKLKSLFLSQTEQPKNKTNWVLSVLILSRAFWKAWLFGKNALPSHTTQSLNIYITTWRDYLMNIFKGCWITPDWSGLILNQILLVDIVPLQKTYGEEYFSSLYIFSSLKRLKMLKDPMGKGNKMFSKFDGFMNLPFIKSLFLWRTKPSKLCKG